jgi:hypothetical protein
LDSSGIYIAPSDSNNFVDSRDYGFNVTTGSLGYGGNDGSTNGRYLYQNSSWTGDCTPGTNRCNASITLDTSATDNGVANTVGRASFSLTSSAGATNAGFGQASLTLRKNNDVDYGFLIFNARMDFRGGTQTTIGAAGSASATNTPVGYIKIAVGGSDYIVPYYNP